MLDVKKTANVINFNIKCLARIGSENRPAKLNFILLFAGENKVKLSSFTSANKVVKK